LQLGQVLLAVGDASATEHLAAALAGTVPGDDGPDAAATADIHAEAAFTLALVAQLQKDLPEFINRLEQTLEFDPTHVRARLISAAVALAQQEMHTARQHLEVLLAQPPLQRPTEEDILARLPYP